MVFVSLVVCPPATRFQINRTKKGKTVDSCRWSAGLNFLDRDTRSQNSNWPIINILAPSLRFAKIAFATGAICIIESLFACPCFGNRGELLHSASVNRASGENRGESKMIRTQSSAVSNAVSSSRAGAGKYLLKLGVVFA